MPQIRPMMHLTRRLMRRIELQAANESVVELPVLLAASGNHRRQDV